ncbi:MAG: hypothetical protein QMC81_01560 [Thermoanaerobacterales bacterium]|nr:hypothetical protein [Thermoanaerobacterales bacterium]
MKIGAGGLQSMLTYDAIAARKVDPAQARPGVTDEQNLVAKQLVGLEELIRLVEHLNRLAELSNYPFRFRVHDEKEGKEKGGDERSERDRRQRRLRVELVDEHGRHQRFLTDDELDRARRSLSGEGEEPPHPAGLGLNAEV